jgi:hypothetical protein
VNRSPGASNETITIGKHQSTVGLCRVKTSPPAAGPARGEPPHGDTAGRHPKPRWFSRYAGAVAGRLLAVTSEPLTLACHGRAVPCDSRRSSAVPPGSRRSTGMVGKATLGHVRLAEALSLASFWQTCHALPSRNGRSRPGPAAPPRVDGEHEFVLKDAMAGRCSYAAPPPAIQQSRG